MRSKQRRHFTAETKAQLVRRHLADKVAVSDLADEFGIRATGWAVAVDFVGRCQRKSIISNQTEYNVCERTSKPFKIRSWSRLASPKRPHEVLP